MTDPYKTLGVAPDASQEEIRQAYRRCAMKYHPDRNPGNAQAEAAFKECQNAYAILGDEAKRRQHDRGGPFGFDPGSGDLNDLFRSIFDTIVERADRVQRQTGRGEDLEFDLDVSLEEALLGGEHTVRYQTDGPCKACEGTGSTDKQTDTCSGCGGAGVRRVKRGFFVSEETCTTCQGRARTPRSPCKSCRGSGKKATQQEIKFTLPGGVDTGDRINLEGHGGYGVTRGDLLLTVRVRPHDRFQRQGADLHCALPLRVSQAALGSQVEIPTPLGHITMKVPAGTQNGSVLVAKGGGGVTLASKVRGHLHCHVIVETPVNLTVEQRDILRRLEETYSPPPSKA